VKAAGREFESSLARFFMKSCATIQQLLVKNIFSFFLSVSYLVKKQHLNNLNSGWA